MSEANEIRKMLEPCEKDAEIAKLNAELAVLKQFAREFICAECWDCGEPDGGTVQDMAERLGLICESAATEADCKDYSDFEVGDPFYRFTAILKDESEATDGK